MAYETERLFLLSLLIPPGCVGRTTDDDDSAEPQRELGDGCRAYYEAAIACYPAYETSGGYPYEPGSYCDYITNELVEYYGEPCARAMDDFYACIAELECEQLGDAFLALCSDAWKKGHAACPEMFPACECGESWSSSGMCATECETCIDGNRYAAECTPDAANGTSTCTCSVNGEVTQTITDLADPCDDFDTTVHDRCMIP